MDEWQLNTTFLPLENIVMDLPNWENFDGGGGGGGVGKQFLIVLMRVHMMKMTM